MFSICAKNALNLRDLTRFEKNGFHTNLQSKVYRGGKEEATQAYSNIRRGADDAANKGRRMNANWYQLLSLKIIYLFYSFSSEDTPSHFKHSSGFVVTLVRNPLLFITISKKLCPTNCSFVSSRDIFVPGGKESDITEDNSYNV